MRNNFKIGRILDGRFETISPLNHGSFGMVFMARDLHTQDLVAIKCLTKRSASTEDSVSAFAIDDKSEELESHRTLGNHPNIVNLIHSFETDAHVYLVLEYCSRGDLYEAIRSNRGPLETEHVREFMLELVDAVSYIHSKGIAHRDIKPENIFLTHNGTLKLGDFGLATKETWTYETTVGSDRYMSPEQYDSDGAGYSPTQADIWAIGICLLNILFSRNPFMKPAESDPLFLDFSRDKQSLLDVFPDMSLDTFEVITHCMSLDPKKRSLSLAREALVRALSFTYDDESLDKFCSGSGSPTIATIDREPLRTPSVSSPQMDQGVSFPWAKALHASPPQPIRQLSTIHDTEIYDEDLFPSSEESNKDWFSVGGKTPSIGSLLTASIGESMKNLAIRRPAKKSGPPRPDLTPVSGSLPIHMAKPKTIPSMASIFKKHDTVSKSWSDLWDEEIEELEEDNHDKDVQARSDLNSRTWSNESKIEDTVAARQPLSEKPSSVGNVLAVQVTSTGPIVHSVDDIDGDINDGFFFQDATPQRKASPTRYSPPSKRTTFDKWAALGDRRRGASTSDTKVPEVWGRGRRNSNINTSTSGHHHFINGALANTNSVAGFPSTHSGSSIWELWGKDKGHAGGLNSSKSTLGSNFGSGFHNAARAKTSGRCPWDKDRKSPTQSKEKLDFGSDVEWVGGWQDEHSLDFGLQL